MDDNKLISHVQVQKSVEALLKINKEKSADKEVLNKGEDAVLLQFALKKVPLAQKVIKLKLPNGLSTEREVCLFVKDLDKADREYEKTVRHFKQKLKEAGINCVSQVIPLKALKLEYKPFDAKRKLSNSFDVFLADARIIRLLPAYLGKAFYGRKRFPVQVRMDSKDLKEEFETAISSSRCIFSGRGSVGIATVGTTDMSVAELAQNIMVSANQITAGMPGGAVNIRNMYIKTEASMAVPVYISTGSANEVQLPTKAKTEALVLMDEVTTVERALVKVYPSGVVKVVDELGKAVRAKRNQNQGKNVKMASKTKRPAKAVKRAGKKAGAGKKKVK